MDGFILILIWVLHNVYVVQNVVWHPLNLFNFYASVNREKWTSETNYKGEWVYASEIQHMAPAKGPKSSFQHQHWALTTHV